jgi:8-oxo-dGTP pyrophosphatase MutT (NUDIX family)
VAAEPRGERLNSGFIMAETSTFGSVEPGIDYTERRASYVVVVNTDGQVAMVRGRQNYFLPGGGSEPGEAPEDTIRREVREELARGVRLAGKVCEAIQYFDAPSDDRHYRMHAVFFAGEFTDEPCDGGEGEAEHSLEWLPLINAERNCFHASHAWAIRQA